MTNAALAIACIVYAAVYIIHSRFNFQFWPEWQQSIVYAVGALAGFSVGVLLMVQA